MKLSFPELDSFFFSSQPENTQQVGKKKEKHIKGSTSPGKNRKSDWKKLKY